MNDQEVGYVESNHNYLIYLTGLPTVKVNDLIVSTDGGYAIVSALHESSVEALMLTEKPVAPGLMFKNANQTLSIEVGDFLLGRSINPLGVPIDGKGMVGKDKEKSRAIEQTARGLESREFITDQLNTGITLTDILVPLGLGQRELIIGDSHAGKNNFLVDLIVNQTKAYSEPMICIFACIGKPIATIKNLINTLAANKVLSRSIIVASSSSEKPPLIYLTPLVAMTIAEYFQGLGKNVLVILDDMGNHAKTYREISLLGKRIPGRESYPGDIFFIQAKILERAGKFNSKFGGGSITAFPVIEINQDDFTGLIPTNLISITDGLILFKSSLYSQNQHPAIDISLSVSRVGRQTQKLVCSLLSRRVRRILAESKNLETLNKFSSELPAETQLILHQKDLIQEIINQPTLTSIPIAIQTILLGLVFTNFFKDKDVLFLKQNKNKLIQAFSENKELLQITQKILELKSDIELIQILEKIPSSKMLS